MQDFRRIAIVIPFAAFLSVLLCDCDSTPPDTCKTILQESGVNCNDSINTLYQEEYSEESNPISRLSVFVENSGSMDGYVTKSATNFKSKLGSIIPTLLRRTTGINDDSHIYEINTKVFDCGLVSDYKQYLGRLSPSSLKGNAEINNCPRTDTDVSECFEIIVDSLRRNEGMVAMFVSDCVFSPIGDSVVEVLLEQNLANVEEAMGRLYKYDKNYGVLVYRYMSDFHTIVNGNKYLGAYFLKNNVGIPLSEQRPFYVWIFGKTRQLAEIRRALQRHETTDNLFVEFGSVAHIPYAIPTHKESPEYGKLTCPKSKHKHITDPTLIKKNRMQFAIDVDFSAIPLSDSILLQPTSYEVQSDLGIYVEKVEIIETQEPQVSGYTHRIVLMAEAETGRSLELRGQYIVNVLLKRPELSSLWTETYNDPTGEDYHRVRNDSIPATTFGIASLIEGTYTMHKSSKSYAKMTIIIN